MWIKHGYIEMNYILQIMPISRNTHAPEYVVASLKNFMKALSQRHIWRHYFSVCKVNWDILEPAWNISYHTCNNALLPGTSIIKCINKLRPWQNGRHFADDILKCIFLNENARISLKMSLKFVPKVRINNIPALVQIMAWRRPGDKPLSEPMMFSLLTHICVTRPQWVNDTWLTISDTTFQGMAMLTLSSKSMY